MPSAPGTRLSLFLLIASTLVTSACQKSLPSAPSELVEGATVYEHDSFRGESAYLTGDIPDLEKFNGPCVKQDSTTLPNGGTVNTQPNSWDNCISSIRLAPGWRAMLYGDDDYGGARLEVTTDIADLKNVPGSCDEGFNDCVSSIRVFRP